MCRQMLNQIQKPIVKNLNLLGKIFLLFCRKPPADGPSADRTVVENTLTYRKNLRLDLLLSFFPGMNKSFFSHRRVIEFGSGQGQLAFDLSSLADEVIGLEIRDSIIELAEKKARELGLENVRFLNSSRIDHRDLQADVILSVDAMEHFDDPAFILDLCSRCLNPNGSMILTFGPTWYHPRGHHMSYICPIPWFHLVVPKKMIMNVRKLWKTDGAESYREISGGLNKMTLKRFRDYIRDSPFEINSLRIIPIRRCGWLGRIPLIREFFISVVACRLDQSGVPGRVSSNPPDAA
jgi:SAM-dependent methyltransferase